MNITLIGLMVFAQYFGQNKIQYRDFSFNVLRTEHFDIYFYEGGDGLASFAEEVLEDGYIQLEEDLGIEIEFRIPVILYNSPNDFAQTNITLELIEEAVGGFTEILKNRMVIPFTGDYEEFRHVLVHELTHVFQFVIFFPSRMEAIFTGDLFYSIPLWVMEGYAEYESLEWDTNTEIIIKDMVIHNSLIPLPVLGNYAGFIVYKEGQAFYHYLAERYSREKAGEFLHIVKSKKNVDAAFISLFGVTIEDFNEQWLRYLQRKYWPDIGLLDNFDDFARVIYDHKKTKSLYNTSTAISSSGDKIAFIGDKNGIAEIILISSIDGQILKRLVKSYYSPGYEGLHLYQGGLDFSPDDKYITFAARARGRDILYIIDAVTGKINYRYRLDLDGVYNPSFSPDASQIIFSGMKNGYSDIYIIDLDSGNLEKITDDIYTDRYPTFANSGLIAFVSDRPDQGDDFYYGNYAVFIADNNVIERLTNRASYVTSPIFTSENDLYFVADYDSAFNLYYYDQEQRAITHRTDIHSGIFYPTISASGDKIAFSYMMNYGYDVCVVKNPFEKMIACEEPDSRPGTYYYEESELDPDDVRRYRPKFTFDYVTATASYYSVLGISGLGQIALSDILGNHHIQISADFYGNITNSDIFINYWFLKKRTDYGITLFQYLNYFRAANDLVIWRYLGGGLNAQYPISRFFRFEFGVYAYKVYETGYRDYFTIFEPRYYQGDNYNFFYPNISFVFDNISWGLTGPHKGRRARVTGYTTIFSDFDYTSIILDYRRYLPITSRASFAVRLVGAASLGPDDEIWSIGGPYSIHGFRYYEFSGAKVGFANLELRVPVIDHLKIAFPIPLEFRNIRGALFADFGGVYSDSFQVYSTDGGFHLQDLKMGVGAGLRFSLLYMIFKLDFSRPTDLQNWLPNRSDGSSVWRVDLTLGSEW